MVQSECRADTGLDLMKHRQDLVIDTQKVPMTECMDKKLPCNLRTYLEEGKSVETLVLLHQWSLLHKYKHSWEEGLRHPIPSPNSLLWSIQYLNSSLTCQGSKRLGKGRHKYREFNAMKNCLASQETIKKMGKILVILLANDRPVSCSQS